MLLYFKGLNISSYQDIDFSMVAGNYREHPESKVELKKYGVDVLKSAVVYGANASGKSNFLKVISRGMLFVKNSFSGGQEENNHIPFFYNENHNENLKKPVSFKYGILIDGIQFEYSFSVDNERILDEELLEYRSQKPIQARSRGCWHNCRGRRRPGSGARR